MIKPLRGAASVAVGLISPHGSRHERDQEAGLSHLAEHMYFQGTRRRDNRELSRVINAVGGTLDAYTSREAAAFYPKVPAAHFSLALDVLADMFAASRFDPVLLEKEKRIILEEIRMYEDEPEDRVHERFARTLWPRHGLGRPILGFRRVLRNVRRGDLTAFVRRHFQPRDLIMAVAGRVDPDDAEDSVRRLFASLPNHPGRPNGGPPAPPPAAGAGLERRDYEQVHLCLGCQGIAYQDPRRAAVVGLANILGGGTHSRLFYEVRERRGLAYSVYTFMDFYRDTGSFGVYAACSPSKVFETLEVLKTELRRVVDRTVSEQELTDLKEQLRGNLLLSLENTSTHMWRMVQHESYLGRQESVAQTLRAIERLTRNDIRSIARELLLQRPLAISAVGNLPRKQERLLDFSLV